MILKQFYLNCLAHASYLIGDERSGGAAIVDPQRDIEQYVAFADERGLRIAHVFLTHFHADFVAGHLELRGRTGASIYLGASARAEYAFTPLGTGERVEFGDVRLECVETPGHTAESISILVYDLATILEDLAGNRIGRAFEADSIDTSGGDTAVQTVCRSTSCRAELPREGAQLRSSATACAAHAVAEAISSGASSTLALAQSTEARQF